VRRLRHHRQREIVAVAAFVVGLEIIAVYRHDCAVGQVAEGAADRRSASIIDYCKYDAGCQCPAPNLSGQIVQLDQSSSIRPVDFSGDGVPVRRSSNHCCQIPL
jgi:hypothetical protein